MSQRTRRWSAIRAIVAAAVIQSALPCCAQDLPSAATGISSRDSKFRVYSHLLDPREHPDYERRAVRPPSWETFKDRTQFTCLRGFNVVDDRIVGYAEEIEKFTRTQGLGDVIWPSYPILFAKNLGELADEIQSRGLFLFDVWGYVPGSGPGGYWQQFTPPREAFVSLESKLGDHWLGTDIGEQDGRYIGGYADQMTPASASRFEQYLNFQRHFERMSDDLGRKHATLVSLNYGHYLLKEGTYTLIGAETAQALPNNQVYYAFIRGAGKQYGVPWFGNASIFNRWGFKTYGSSGKSDGYEHGPSKGSSLSLLKRLLYCHILYNSVAVGFENGWFQGDQLSPIGRIQKAAQVWVREHGQPGAMHTPVALLLDFYSGWTFPRHLYSDKTYRVWGNLPYGEGDYLTDAVLELVYPGYQDSSYFHDESGFITSTPYGDSADCLLSDAPGWLLDRYPLLIVAGELRGGLELRDKLENYARNGGHLALPAGDLTKLPGGLAGLTNATTIVSTNLGKGRLTILGPAFGVDLVTIPKAASASKVDRPLAKPYALRPAFREAVHNLLDHQQLFTAGTNLSCITCRKGPGEYTLGVLNNSWRELPLQIVSRCGPIESIVELPLGESEKNSEGYLPEGVDGQAIGQSTEHSIAGGDVRIFLVRVEESDVEGIPHRRPPPRPRERALPLRKLSSIKEEILARPTFFEHFESVVVDGTYLRERERAALQREAGWLQRQGLRIYVDLSSAINLYPDLRLIDNLDPDYQESMATVRDVLAKMNVLGARDLILSLHRHPENNFTSAQTDAAFVKTLSALAKEAAQEQTTVHLRLAHGKPPWNLKEASALLDRVGARNLRLAASTALLVSTAGSDESKRLLHEKLGLWLVAAPRSDLAGRVWDAHTPIHGAPELNAIAQWLSQVDGRPRVLDGVYADQDQEYLDAKALDQLPKRKPD
jgi:hypothetical protein